MKNIIQSLKIITLALILSFGISYVYAWTEPIVTPPGGNVSAPVNVSSTAQYKEGAFGIGGLFRGYANAIFDGNVGIGATSPAGRLQIGTLSSGVNGSINGASNPTRLIVNGATGSEAALTLGYYSSGYGLNLWVPANPSAPWPTYIDNINAYSGFRFRNNTSATPVELMTIDATGRVGIGVPDPTQKLDVAGNIKGTGACIGTDCKTAWPIGATGPQGPAGATGATGATGAQGPAGATGATGATGAQGPVGATGATGATGPQGPAGATPPAGSTFLDTSSTAQTKSGALTAAGLTTTNRLTVGEAGGAYTYITMKDDESPNGVKYVHANSNVVGFLSGYGGWLSYWDNAGSQYNVGNINANDYYIRASGMWASQIGATGPQGPAGATGATGATGAQGPAGATGATGATGAQGPAGATGATGATGPQGPAGNTFIKQTTIYQAPAKATTWCWTDGSKQTCTNTCNGQLTTASTCLYAGTCASYSCDAASAFANTNLGALVQ